mgnify:CR=1 FL=1
MESIRVILTQFTDETISIFLAVLVIVFAALIAYWVYNRRKFHQLSHQIPASVVKNYLDSIIANSTALKSSLFRGGGLELGEGIPSIIPASDLPAGGVSVGGASSEELATKNAEIANLKAMLNQKDVTIAELEKMLEAARSSSGGDSDEELNILRSEVSSLKAQLEESNTALEAAKSATPSSGGADPAELEKVTQERDELKERLMEYEIIEEDLANLKKFQQENEELKKTIAELQGGAPAEAAAPEAAVEEAPAEEAVAEEPAAVEEAPAEEAPAETPEEAPAQEAVAEEPASEEAPAAEASVDAAADGSSEGIPDNDGEQKSAAELLSEFEKMLG